MPEWLHEEIAEVISRLAADLAPRARRLLELGIGTGDLAARLLNQLPGAAWVGYEGDPEVAERAASRLEFMGAGLSIVPEDFRSASFAGPFDLAVSVAGMIGLAPEEKGRVFHAVHRVLDPGGAFLFGDAVRPPSEGIAAAYRAREREDLAAEGLTGGAVTRQTEQDARRGSPWSAEEELYRLRKAAFLEVDLVWKRWDRAVYAALR